jgi:hypothetical protein
MLSLTFFIFHYSFFICIDPIEKSLLKQRFANLPAAQNGYVEKQKLAMQMSN